MTDDRCPQSVDNTHRWVDLTSILDNRRRLECFHCRTVRFDPTPAQASQDRPRRDETPAEGGTDGSAAPDASQGCTCDHHADALDSIRNARTLGGDAGIAEGLAAIAHAILHGQERP